MGAFETRVYSREHPEHHVHIIAIDWRH